MRHATILILVLGLAGCFEDAAPPDSCPDVEVAPYEYGKHPIVAGRVGSPCQLEQAPDGGLGSNCLDPASDCLTDNFGFPGGSCVTIDACDAATQTGCPDGAVCFAFNDHTWCFHSCVDDMDCRHDEGYRCQGGACFAACSTDEDCAGRSSASLVCDVGPGRCVQDQGCPATACAADEECVGFGTGAGARCLRRCDLLVQDCPDGQGCARAPSGLAVCTATGFVALGEACSEWNECARGTQCDGGVCEAFCAPGADCSCSARQVAPD